ncbi:MFS transporter [Cumulibacter manganitolerans]|uniref:MFS transporter n=1 Tax=Cumulibacter manganitolerans TaxID=1884992 RepID=UPI0012969D2A|nr:MFS transporter [Cumulibacter manganitolerans]
MQPLTVHRTAVVYRRRFAVLAAVMAVNFSMQLLWIGYAPITTQAAAYYGASELQIGLLSLVFMAAFVPLAIPASWLLDTRGFRFAVGIGSVATAVAALARGAVGGSYAGVLASTIVIACCQPLLLNAWSLVAGNWFPERRRASAIGQITLANLLGTAAGMVATPLLVESMSIAAVQLCYGAVAALSAALFLTVAREHPPTPPEPGEMRVRTQMLAGLRTAITTRGMGLLLVAVFVGMGVFNGIATWIEQIVAPRGMDAEQAGLVGAAMLGGGLVGAVLLSWLSDRLRRRVAFLVAGLIGAAVSLTGFAFSSLPWQFFVCAGALGFFLAGLLPLVMQYAAEETYPVPEATSNGLLQLAGQCGLVLALLMSALRTAAGSYVVSLSSFAIALLLLGGLVARLRDPRILRAATD